MIRRSTPPTTRLQARMEARAEIAGAPRGRVGQALQLARTLHSDLEWAAIWLRGGERQEHAGFVLLSRLAELLCPRYVLTDPGRSWFDDGAFFRDYYRRDADDLAADRRFMLRELLGQVDGVPGDTVECGVYQGASSWIICDHFRGSGRVHHGFDSFEGLSEPSAADGPYWRPGDLRSPEAAVRTLLAPFAARLYRGWIPERFGEVDDRRFAFVHIDVDLYQPTRDSLEFFYPRVSPGGIMVVDDYGFRTCPGAARAVDEFLSDKPERVLHVPTGQGVIIRRQPIRP